MRHWRHEYKTPAISQMELFVALVHNFQPLTNTTKNYLRHSGGPSLDPALKCSIKVSYCLCFLDNVETT